MKTKSIMKLGIIPIGYADGFSRNFGHGKDDEDINSGTNFNIRMDGSQAWPRNHCLQ